MMIVATVSEAAMNNRPALRCAAARDACRS
jgi:hypothetical protein